MSLSKWKPAHISDAEWEEMKRAEAEREDKIEHGLKRAQMRMLALGADNGSGRCSYCGCVIEIEMVDGQEHKLHPLDVTCVRPRFCPECGASMHVDDFECDACRARRVAADSAARAAAAAPIEMKPVRKQRNLFGERDDDDDD